MLFECLNTLPFSLVSQYQSLSDAHTCFPFLKLFTCMKTIVVPDLRWNITPKHFRNHLLIPHREGISKATFPGVTYNVLKCYIYHVEKGALALAVKVLFSKIRCFISFTKLSHQSKDEVKLLSNMLSENGFFRTTYRFLDIAIRAVMKE